MKRIVLTGGGSAGHVTPNLALIQELKKEGWDIHYIGTEDGIERSIISNEGIPYHPIEAGKLRRYFNVKNITDPFRVVKGIFQAKSIIRKLKPNVVFSKGGFVSVPVVIGGWMNRIPVIIHESDITPGLANKLSAPFAAHICSNFEVGTRSFKKGKAIYTGTPIRKEIFCGDYNKGLSLCGFEGKKPIVMVMGGSLGSRNINKLVREGLDLLLEHFDVVHICGKGNIDDKLLRVKGYKQFEYVSKELPHIMKAASIVISRAGANSIFELLELRIPNILIPLSSKSSRGDQILNAREFEKLGFSKVLMEDGLDSNILYQNVLELYKNRNSYIENMKKRYVPNGTKEIMKLIDRYSK